MGTVVVPDCVGVEHFAGVECVVAGLLEPDGEVVLIVTVLDEDGEAAWLGVSAPESPQEEGQCTVGRVEVRHVGVVSELSRPKTRPRRTADGCCAVVMLEKGTLIDETFLDEGDVVQGVHPDVLVVCEDEDDVGTLGLAFKLRTRGAEERNLEVIGDN